jgi:hypothetical protein
MRQMDKGILINNKGLFKITNKQLSSYYNGESSLRSSRDTKLEVQKFKSFSWSLKVISECLR